MDKGTEVYFHRQVEQPGNYACPGGSIINSEKVCDALNHCDSGYDEQDCKDRILISDFSEPANINVTASIIDVLDIRYFN